MSGIGSAEQIEIDKFGISIVDGGGESGTICQFSGSIGNDRSCTSANVVGSVSLNPQLRGQISSQGVELVGIATSDENTSVRQDIGSGVIDARNVGSCQGLESSAWSTIRVVHHGCQHWVLCIPPSLCTVSSSVDDEDIAIRQ